VTHNEHGSGCAAADPGASAVAFDRAAAYYDRTRGYPDGVGELVADLFCRAGQLGPTSTVLEIGVGTGRIALPLAARVQRVVGVDLARPMLARLCSKLANERVLPLIADAVALPFANARFDAVVGMHVFHLLPAWRVALAEVRRVLAPHGYYLDAQDSQLLPELWEAAYQGLTKPANVGVDHGATDFPSALGFRAAGEPSTLRFPVQVSLSTFLRNLEERVWSATWRLSDDDHARLCDNMRAAIMVRFGSLDTVLDLERQVSVRAFAPPA
jgi:ubiquinone/menaquinone biosynthesis C-methylase UbiE